ncbi:hypothetical protein OG379_28955 [Streptomyces sp. NBC_01166]|nr:hypothetical protein OG379_28955 [Streptomyces sp. NBC_01166]
MNPVEYKSARRERILGILIDVAAGVVSSLLVTALTAVANLFF